MVTQKIFNLAKFWYTCKFADISDIWLATKMKLGEMLEHFFLFSKQFISCQNNNYFKSYGLENSFTKYKSKNIENWKVALFFRYL